MDQTNKVEAFAASVGADTAPRAGASVRLTILGELCSKANSREPALIGKKGAQRIIWRKSDKALAFERAASLQITRAKRLGLTGPIRLTVVVFYSLESNDLDVELLKDCLQNRTEVVDGRRVVTSVGVFANDRQVKEVHAYHGGIDKRNPRVEVLVEEMVETVDDRWRLALASQESLGLPFADEMQGELSHDESQIGASLPGLREAIEDVTLEDDRPVAF